MLRCEHCKVDLPGTPARCPLCQNTPTGAPDSTGNRYPTLPPVQKTFSSIMLLWIAFGSVCAGAICFTINLILPAGGWWSLFVIAGIASFWVDFAIMLKKRKNVPKGILWQVGAMSLIANLWDRFTGFRGWSIDYVLPVLSICAMFGITLLAKLRKMHIQDYILYLVMVCILGIVSFVLILVGTVNVVVPSAISFGSSIIFLAALLFFEGKALWAEVQRRLHF